MSNQYLQMPNESAINRLDYVRTICKKQRKKMKDLASNMKIDLASLTRALNGNARFDTIQKIANSLLISLKSLFEPTDDIGGT